MKQIAMLITLSPAGVKSAEMFWGMIARAFLIRILTVESAVAALFATENCAQISSHRKM